MGLIPRDACWRHALIDLVVSETGRDACTPIAPVTSTDTGQSVLPLTRATQVDYEQPGCLHAAMDCYKWAAKLGPLVPGDLLLDCFELAREIRYTDMAASPYDFTSYDLAPIRIESPDGKAEYVRRQRNYAERSNRLRQRLLAACAPTLGRPPEPGTGPVHPDGVATRGKKERP